MDYTADQLEHIAILMRKVAASERNLDVHCGNIPVYDEVGLLGTLVGCDEVFIFHPA